MELASAKAVISGGASGLGLATAQRVIDAGGQVVLLDINDEQGEASAASLGERAAYLNTDVANEESVQKAMAAANETMGGITLAVNCAGIATAGRTLGRDGPWRPHSCNTMTPTPMANAVLLSVPRQSQRSKVKLARLRIRRQKVAWSA
jgi:NAD(P)-dependent dehydrogenase (short-subunit alcohol dehydrogenase family)